MTSLNEAFGRLRAILPQKNVSSASNHVEEDSSRGPTKELSKMEALQTAQAYIAELSRLLRENWKIAYILASLYANCDTNKFLL